MKKYVLLENVRSKFNVGAVFRTAECFSFDGVILTGFTPGLPDKEIAKTAIGAEEVVSWQYWQKAGDAILDLKKRGVRIVVAEINDRAVDLNQYKIKNNTEVCIVLGNEIEGVSDEVLELADDVVRIPMLGSLKESLNVEVAFGIMAYISSQWSVVRIQ